jgi:hypothetical protein
MRVIEFMVTDAIAAPRALTVHACHLIGFIKRLGLSVPRARLARVPMPRHPSGGPVLLTPDHGDVIVNRAALLKAAHEVVGQDIDPVEHAHADDHADYLDDQLAHAARLFVRAVDGLPAEHQPVGWNEEAR